MKIKSYFYLLQLSALSFKLSLVGPQRFQFSVNLSFLHLATMFIKMIFIDNLSEELCPKLNFNKKIKVSTKMFNACYKPLTKTNNGLSHLKTLFPTNLFLLFLAKLDNLNRQNFHCCNYFFSRVHSSFRFGFKKCLYRQIVK